MYSVELTKKAKVFVSKLQKRDAEIILRRIYSIRENPFPHIKKLRGTKLWRLRILKYRAILDIIISGKRIIVLRIGKRSKVYD